MSHYLTLCFTLIFIIVGCATSKVWVKRGASTRIGSNEAVTIILFDDFLQDWRDDFRGGGEEEVAECIGRAMKSTNKKLRIISPGEFRSSFYPWFEHSTEPKSLEELKLLLNKSIVRDRITSLGLRYLIVLSGKSSESQKHGHLGFYPYFGFQGHEWWEKHSLLSATIWDLKDASSVGEIGGSALGTASNTGAMLFPIYKSSLTEFTLCKNIGEKLGKFLSGGDSQSREYSKPPP
ncbi:MAG: hypothetical protein ACU826_03680 [Gammaproteobacteria bacterium]